MSLSLLLDLSSPVPASEQVRAQIAAHLSAGRLRPGERLPTMRALAADLGLAVGTVARSYRELEAAGLVISRRRTGTVVAEQAGPADGTDEADATQQRAELRSASAAFVRRSRTEGWSDEEILTSVRGALLAPTRDCDAGPGISSLAERGRRG